MCHLLRYPSALNENEFFALFYQLSIKSGTIIPNDFFSFHLW